MYRVCFRKADDGNPLCSTCGLQVGHHAVFPPPDTTIEQYGSDPTLRLRESGAVAPYPPHWVGAAWYAPFVEFAERSRNRDTEGEWRATLKYRCTLEGCNQLFEMEGALLNRTSGTAIGPVSLRTIGYGESIEAHMERVHGLKHLPARRFATSLLGRCEDPITAATCPVRAIFCCWPNTFKGIVPDSPVPARGRTSIPSKPVDGVQCRPHYILMVLAMPFVALYYVMWTVGDMVTLCGFPCNSDSLPPMMCSECYVHRRRLAHVLDADESRFCTRVKATFCCYCSEVQVWREVKASGVWPGQLCCTASQSDREHMARAAVRGRYSVDGEYAVEATSPAGARLLVQLRLLEQLWDNSTPNLCYRMK
jgi:hypothetical protein